MSIWDEPNITERAGLLWRQGVSAGDIRKAINREFGATLSRSAVIGKVWRMGWSDEGRGAVSRPHTGGRRKTEGAAEAPRPPAKPKPPQRTANVIAMTPSVAPAYIPPVDTAPWKAPVRVERPGTATMATIRNGLCRWPLGDPKAPDFAFCGCRCEIERPYCDDHRVIAYQPETQRQQAARVARTTRSFPL